MIYEVQAVSISTTFIVGQKKKNPGSFTNDHCTVKRWLYDLPCHSLGVTDSHFFQDDEGFTGIIAAGCYTSCYVVYLCQCWYSASWPPKEVMVYGKKHDWCSQHMQSCRMGMFIGLKYHVILSLVNTFFGWTSRARYISIALGLLQNWNTEIITAMQRLWCNK